MVAFQRPSVVRSVKLATVATPPGICEIPPTVDLGQYALSIPMRCNAPGVTTISLQPAPGVTSAQAQFTVRIIVRAPEPEPLGLPARVLTGAGLQSPMTLTRPFAGTLTSADPARVR